MENYVSSCTSRSHLCRRYGTIAEALGRGRQLFAISEVGNAPRARPSAIATSVRSGGQGGIRTLERLSTVTHFPGVRLKPLGHLSRSPRSQGAEGEGAEYRGWLTKANRSLLPSRFQPFRCPDHAPPR